MGPMLNPDDSLFENPPLAYSAAEGLYAGGADVVMHAAGRSGFGVFQAARDLSTADRKLWAIGVDADQSLSVAPDVREFVLTSAVKSVDLAIVNSVGAYLDGSIAAGNQIFDSYANVPHTLIGGGAIDSIDD